MKIEEALQILNKTIDESRFLARFDPITREQGTLLNKDIEDLANACEVLKNSYKQSRADVLLEIVKSGHCEDADCFECAFGTAEGCVIEKVLKENQNE